MNSWFGIGNVGGTPTLRQTNSGRSVLNFRIAVDRYYNRMTPTGQTERVHATDWIPVVVWGPQAEVQARHLQKGSKVAIEGELRSRSYQREDGVTIHTLEVHASRVTWLDKIRSQGAEAEVPQSYSSPEEVSF